MVFLKLSPLIKSSLVVLVRYVERILLGFLCCVLDWHVLSMRTGMFFSRLEGGTLLLNYPHRLDRALLPSGLCLLSKQS